MRVIYCLSVFIFLLCGCINTNTDSKSKSELEEKLYPLSKEDTELNLDTLQEYAPDFNGYVYIMNSDCSSCIAEFLSFAKELAESEYNGDLLVIISNATQPIRLRITFVTYSTSAYRGTDAVSASIQIWCGFASYCACPHARADRTNQSQQIHFLFLDIKTLPIAAGGNQQLLNLTHQTTGLSRSLFNQGAVGLCRDMPF